MFVKSIPDASGEVTLGPDHLVQREGEGVLDPGDEYAVEAALTVTETSDGEVTVVSMGPPNASAAIRRALAMGAHRAVHVKDDALRGADVLATAKVLAAAASRTSFDLLLAGVESTDGYTGTLPMTVAELLGVPSATFARKIEATEGAVRVERQTDAGFDLVECPLPALVTVTASAAEPRFPTLKGIMAAKQKPFEELSVADLGLDAGDLKPSQRVVSVEPAEEKATGEVIRDDDDAPARIVRFLTEAKVF